MAFDLRRASDLLDAPQSFKDCRRGVFLPFLRSGPGILPIRPRKAARRGLSPDLTGAPINTAIHRQDFDLVLEMDHLLNLLLKIHRFHPSAIPAVKS